MQFLKSKALVFWFSVVSVITIAVILSNPNEPRVQGKRVSDWLDEIEYKGLAAGVEAPRGDAAFMILTNAGPDAAHLLATIWRNGRDRSRLTRVREQFTGNVGFDGSRKPGFVRGWCALQVVACMGADAEAAVPTFVEALTDSRAEVRMEAVFALGYIPAARSVVVPALLETTFDGTIEVARAAVVALGKQKTNAVDALPRLEMIRDDRRHPMRPQAAFAIALIDPAQLDSCLDELIAKAEESPGRFPDAAFRLLGEIGPAARSAVPAILRCIDKGGAGQISSHLEQAAWLALEKIDPDTHKAEYKKRGGDAVDRQWNRGPM